MSTKLPDPTAVPDRTQADTGLTNAERERFENTLRWHFNCHAAEPNKSYASLGIQNATIQVEAIIAARVAAARKERGDR